jgi:hypothetical protein
MALRFGIPRDGPQHGSQRQLADKQRQQIRATPRGYRPASRSALAIGGTDLTKQRFVPPPSAIDLGHCHAWYSACRATARSDGNADLVGLRPRRNRGLLPHNQDDGVDAHMLLAAVGCHQLAQALAGSRCDWPQ